MMFFLLWIKRTTRVNVFSTKRKRDEKITVEKRRKSSLHHQKRWKHPIPDSNQTAIIVIIVIISFPLLILFLLRSPFTLYPFELSILFSLHDRKKQDTHRRRFTRESNRLGWHTSTWWWEWSWCAHWWEESRCFSFLFFCLILLFLCKNKFKNFFLIFLKHASSSYSHQTFSSVLLFQFASSSSFSSFSSVLKMHISFRIHSKFVWREEKVGIKNSGFDRKT